MSNKSDAKFREKKYKKLREENAYIARDVKRFALGEEPRDNYGILNNIDDIKEKLSTLVNNYQSLFKEEKADARTAIINRLGVETYNTLAKIFRHK